MRADQVGLEGVAHVLQIGHGSHDFPRLVGHGHHRIGDFKFIGKEKAVGRVGADAVEFLENGRLEQRMRHDRLRHDDVVCAQFVVFQPLAGLIKGIHEVHVVGELGKGEVHQRDVLLDFREHFAADDVEALLRAAIQVRDAGVVKVQGVCRRHRHRQQRKKKDQFARRIHEDLPPQCVVGPRSYDYIVPASIIAQICPEK